MKKSNPRPGVEPVTCSQGSHRSLPPGPQWSEIPRDKIKQADLLGLIAIWDEACGRLWGMEPYPAPKEAEAQRWIDACSMKVIARRLAEHAEKGLGDGTALLQISGLLPTAQPTAEEWDAAWAVVRRLEMQHRLLLKPDDPPCGQKTGVKLLDLALILCDDDKQVAGETKERWRKTREPKLPPRIGTGKQGAYLYEPAAIVEWAGKIETFDKSLVLNLLTAIARPPRRM